MEVVPNYQIPLSGYDTFYWHSAEPYDIAFGMGFELPGQVDHPSLVTRLAALEAQYPLLRARVCHGPNGLHFSNEGVPLPQVQVSHVKAQGESAWLAVMEKELSCPFPLGSGPYFRFHLVLGPSSSFLVATCLHVVCDAISLIELAADLLAPADSGQSEGRVGDSRMDVDALVEQIMADGTGLAELGRDLPEPILASFKERRLTNPDHFSDNLGTPLHLLSYAFSVAQTREIVSCAKQLGLSVHAILCAAVAMAFHRVYPRDDNTFSLLIAADIRHRFIGKVALPPRNLHSLVAMVQPCDAELDLANTAAQFQDTFKKTLTTSGLLRPYVAFAYLLEQGHLLRHPRADQENPVLSLSNMGRLDWASLQRAGVKSIYGPVFNTSKTEVGIGLSTFDNQLTAVFSGRQGYISRESIERIMALVIEELQLEACGQQSAQREDVE